MSEVIDWNKSKLCKHDYEVIGKIVDRVQSFTGVSVKRLSIIMDIEATDMDIPLDLDKLLAFGDYSFMHDIGGIAKHLNRTTGKLEDCFVPRCAKPHKI